MLYVGLLVVMVMVTLEKKKEEIVPVKISSLGSPCIVGWIVYIYIVQIRLTAK